MNWIFTSVFLVTIIGMYYVWGSVLLQALGTDNKQYTHKILGGFISVSFIQWCVGFPAQLLHVSWDTYFWLLLVIYFISSILIIRKYLVIKKDDTIKTFSTKLKKHLENYWFVYLLTGIFSFFSITSQLPYFEMNYDDHYYIGRIVQEIGANQLAIENYFTGSVSGLSFDRILTTYEIGYSFWTHLFNITGPFFARVAMVILNYYLIFIALHTLSSLVIKKHQLTQFGLVGIIFLIIPAGYLWQEGYTLMYDGWQFNTAVWYGSSIVRMAGIPILLLLIPLFKQNKIKGILAYIVVSITLLSFSAITIPMVALLTFAFLVVYLPIDIYQNPNKIVKLINIIILISMLLIIFYMYSFDSSTNEFISKVSQGVKTFVSDNQYRLENSAIFLPTVLFATLSFVFVERRNRIIYAVLVIALISFFIPYTLNFLHFAATGHFFVIARLFTGIQIVLIVLSSSLLIMIISKLFSRYVKIVTPIMSMLLVVLVLIFQLNNLEAYKNITFLGSGISNAGYSVNRVLKNPYMVPIIYEDLRVYFEKQEEERIRIIAPEVIKYENAKLNLSAGLIMSANNIEVCSTPYTGCDKINEDTESRVSIANFLSGDLSEYENLKNILSRYSIDMLLTDNKDVLNFMINNGSNLEITSKSLQDEELYLIKI